MATTHSHIRSLSRVGQLIAFAGIVIMVILFVAIMIFDPYDYDMSGFPMILTSLILTALLAIWGALKFNCGLMLIAFLVSFLSYGQKLLSSHDPLMFIIGLTSMFYLVASILMFIQNLISGFRGE